MYSNCNVKIRIDTDSHISWFTRSPEMNKENEEEKNNNLLKVSMVWKK